MAEHVSYATLHVCSRSHQFFTPRSLSAELSALVSSFPEPAPIVVGSRPRLRGNSNSGILPPHLSVTIVVSLCFRRSWERREDLERRGNWPQPHSCMTLRLSQGVVLILYNAGTA